LLVNRLSTIAFGAQRAAFALAEVPLPGVLTPGVLAPGVGLAVRKGRLADEPAEVDALAPGDASAPELGALL
jgi:hypothetical protein